MDRAQAKVLAQETEAALRDVGGRHGLKVKLGRGVFEPDSFTVKVIYETEDAAQNEFAALAPLYGLQPADFGRAFIHKGHGFTVTGINPRAQRYPVTARRDDGRTFKFGASSVKRLLVMALTGVTREQVEVLK